MKQKTPFQQAQKVARKHGFRITEIAQGVTPERLKDLKDVILLPVGPEYIVDPHLAQLAQVLYEEVPVRGTCVLFMKNGVGQTLSPDNSQIGMEVGRFFGEFLLTMIFQKFIPLPKVQPTYKFLSLVAILEDWTWIELGRWNP